MVEFNTTYDIKTTIVTPGIIITNNLLGCAFDSDAGTLTCGTDLTLSKQQK